MKIAALVLLLAIPATAYAQRESRVDGGKLLGFCTAKATTNCDAYLSGVADAIAALGPQHAPACIPIAVTGKQLREVVVKFLHDHPQDLQEKAGTVTLHAYALAFACHT
jgi:hypothetical protein